MRCRMCAAIKTKRVRIYFARSPERIFQAEAIIEDRLRFIPHRCKTQRIGFPAFAFWHGTRHQANPIGEQFSWGRVYERPPLRLLTRFPNAHLHPGYQLSPNRSARGYSCRAPTIGSRLHPEGYRHPQQAILLDNRFPDRKETRPF